MAEFDSSRQWRRSSRCVDGHCVEVAFFEGRVQLRSSRNPDGAVLTFTLAQWRAFCAAAVAGELVELPAGAVGGRVAAQPAAGAG